MDGLPGEPLRQPCGNPRADVRRRVPPVIGAPSSAVHSSLDALRSDLPPQASSPQDSPDAIRCSGDGEVGMSQRPQLEKFVLIDALGWRFVEGCDFRTGRLAY